MRTGIGGHRYIFTMALLMTACSALLLAQEPEKKEAVKKDVDLQNVQAPSADPNLPRIDLPEFIITGTEHIDLHLDAKGVEDEDRVYAPSRPTPGERTVNVGEALTPKQVKSFTKVPGAMNGKLFAGFGFYGTTRLDGWFGQYDPMSSFVVNGYYSESDDNVKDDRFSRGGFGVRGSYTLPDTSLLIPNAQLDGDVRYGYDTYRAYGSVHPTQDRTLNEIAVSGGIGSRYALPYKSMTGVDYSARTGWSVFSAADSQKASEAGFFLSGTATTRVLETAFRASAEYRVSSFTMTLPGLQSAQWFVLRGEGRQNILPALQVSYAVQQYLYRGNVGAAAGRLYPTVDVRYAFTEQAALSAGFAPAVERNTLASLFQQNRYIRNDVMVLPNDTRVNLYMGMEFSPMDDLTLTAKGSYRQIERYATFGDKDSAKVWEVLYLSGVRAITFDLSAVYKFNGRQQLTAYLNTQSVHQKDSSQALPHLPAATIGSVYHHYFENGVHAEAYLEFHSARYTSFSGGHQNAGYLGSGAKAEMEMFGSFRASAELTNLLGQQYYLWNGYRERTIFLLLGVSYHW